MTKLILPVVVLLSVIVTAQNDSYNNNKFKQLKEELATPNMYRNAAGAPSKEYYQNRADYKMDITIKDDKHQIYGSETITYHNNAPDELTYLWVQLDQNVRAQTSDSKKISTGKMENQSFYSLIRMESDFDGGFKITKVTDNDGKNLEHFINKTMMRIHLAEPLKSGDSFTFNIDWWYNVNERAKIGGRSGYEYFEEEGNSLYTIAQFFPRMCVYNDVEGWQNKQFLGRGEFTLPFGDYEVNITAPNNHVIAATGELQNADEILTDKQKDRFKAAQSEENNPVFIITQKEAEKNEKSKANGEKTWKFKAENVRDFGFASSAKFIWDAMIVKQVNKNVLAMSFYPKEGNPLWERYSTKAVAHTLKIYSRHTFDYPYPVAISVHTDKIGMEYPMICFNGGRPESDGTYSERTKYGLISVIIHEVGHNYFPMIINSDERQWTWMDEGLNTFLQYIAEQEWDSNYPSRSGHPYKITNYMKGDKSKISPIMTNSESIWQFGPNAYSKPATALNILRETILGRENFDYAFKTYAQRWMFKHPTPADLFRTLEDASGTDLDWFWRGWFFTNEHVDLAITDLKWYQLNSKNPVVENEIEKEKEENFKNSYLGQQINDNNEKTYIKRDPSLNDFYNDYDRYAVTAEDKESYNKFFESLTVEEKALLKSDKNYYEISFANKGGLVMPVILKFTFTDNSTEEIRIPAEIWKMNSEKVTKLFSFSKMLKSVELDPFLETADVDTYNNSWPRKEEPNRFELFKSSKQAKNPMQK